jgi:hypothetical protein
VGSVHGADCDARRAVPQRQSYGPAPDRERVACDLAISRRPRYKGDVAPALSSRLGTP